MSLSEYDAVVFDNDGVLIEPTDRDLLAEAVHEAFAAFDATADEAFVRRAVQEGLVAEDALPGDVDLDPAEFWRRREAEVAAVQRRAIRAGEKALYDDAHVVADLDHDTAVVSNNQHETIEFVLDHHGFADVFEVAYGREPTLEGARRIKPDPHYLESALEDLGTRNALYVGDKETDVLAADRAGVDAAFLRREHRADYELSVEPTHEFADLTELAAALSGTASA